MLCQRYLKDSVRGAVCLSWRCPSAGGCQYLNKAQRKERARTKLMRQLNQQIPIWHSAAPHRAAQRSITELAICYFSVALSSSSFETNLELGTWLDKTCQKKEKGEREWLVCYARVLTDCFISFIFFSFLSVCAGVCSPLHPQRCRLPGIIVYTHIMQSLSFGLNVVFCFCYPHYYSGAKDYVTH